jgi:hypothetical protein
MTYDSVTENLRGAIPLYRRQGSGANPEMSAIRNQGPLVTGHYFPVYLALHTHHSYTTVR